jgi:methyl-accepting chemotaxis protein
VTRALRSRPRPSLERQALASCAEQSGALGVELVDVAGDVEAVAGRAADQVQTFTALAQASAGVRSAADQVVRASDEVVSGAEEARACVDGSRAEVSGSLARVEDLSRSVESVGGQLQQVADTIASVSDVAAQIDRIARETHILALNARIEAARSGDEGRGFAVIADSVRTLSERTLDAARGMGSTLQGLAAPLAALQEQGRDAGQHARDVLAGAAAVDGALGDVGGVLDRVRLAAGGITGLAAEVGEQAAATGSSLGVLADGATTTRDDLARARGRVTALLGLSESLLRATAVSGVETLDSPFVRAAQETAARVSALFEAELAAGRTSVADLFDEDYRPVAGSDPAQVTTRFTALTDRLLPAVQEPVLQLDERVVFCAAVDRNGYLPTHNRVFSQPQGKDPAWNAAHCRNRRVFADRTGLAAARSPEAFLLQTYRRDMGGGTHALMKDVSAPVRVQGRHWGAVRIAYRV